MTTRSIWQLSEPGNIRHRLETIRHAAGPVHVIDTALPD